MPFPVRTPSEMIDAMWAEGLINQANAATAARWGRLNMMAADLGMPEPVASASLLSHCGIDGGEIASIDWAAAVAAIDAAILDWMGRG